mgnify:CR=1 FL=1
MNLKDIDLNHIAIIMDGNGRWATNQGLDRTAGHAAGEFSLSRSIDWSLNNKLEWLTVFAFSTENWSRSKEEVDFLAMHKKNVTFETTPQHLTLYAPDCYEKLGSYAQMNPPLRTKEHYDRLWVAIKNNVVDVLGSDHAPHLKRK